MDLKEAIYAEWILGMVQHAIFCPYFGTVLDVRTCSVMYDADGDPAQVMSPEAGKILAEAGLPKVLADAGYTIVVK
jgi:hypothetical protein